MFDHARPEIAAKPIELWDHHAMVAVIDSGDITDVLDRRSVRGAGEVFTVTWKRQEWRGAKSHLALLVDDEDIVRWIGRARGRKGVSDRDRRIEVAEIVEVPEISLEALRSKLPDLYQSGLKLGLLSEAVGRAVVDALVATYPELADRIEHLSRQDELLRPQGERGRILNEERDATGLVLEIGGIAREGMREWSDTGRLQAPSFLAGMGGRSVSEESIINHDIGRFPDLVQEAGGHVDWQVFSNSRRQMFVMNANMEPLEETLGVDVVYFNETFKSFVLVQYKRILREGDGDDLKGWYRPDTHLSRELERMKAVDERYGLSSGDFRLYGQACWVKLCNPDARVDDPRELLKGMYLAREYFVELLEVCKGPRGGVRLGYDNVPRHINNTTFAQLVKDGWIGTRGTGTQDLEDVVRSVLESRRAIVLGAPLSGGPSVAGR